MDFDRWYRRTGKKATVQMWRGAGVAVIGMILSGLLAKFGDRAGDLRPIFDVFAWGPVVLIAIAAALMANGAWTTWRLYRDPIALYEVR